MPEAYTLYYWTACKSFYGRSIGIVLTLEEAKAKGLDITYEIKTPDDAPEGAGFAVPMMTLPSGQHIAQTPAILNAMGTKFGLTGSTEAEQIACQQAVLDMDDVFSEAVAKKWDDKPERAAKWFAYLEKKLDGHKYLVGDTPTVADFHAIFAFEWVNVRYPAGFQDNPKLTQWWKDINEYPVVVWMRANGKMIPV